MIYPDFKPIYDKKKIANRRYYIHRRIQKRYKIDAAKKTVFVPHDLVPSPLHRKYFNYLIILGYNKSFSSTPLRTGNRIEENEAISETMPVERCPLGSRN